MKLSSKLLVGFLGALLTFGACGGNFSPSLDTSGANTDTTGMTTTSDGTTGDATDSAGETTAGSTTGMDMGGSDDTGTGTEGTGGSLEDPFPAEICDPFLIETGPCQNYPEDHPDFDPLKTWTCVPWETMPDPNTYLDEFRCQSYYGYWYGASSLDPPEHATFGDGCLENTGDFEYRSCMNAPCVADKNLLPNDCVSPQYLYGDDNKTDPKDIYYCCSTYCDETNPCAVGYTCNKRWDLDSDGYVETGACVVF